MKLHLPKALLTAVLAACMVNTTAWGGWGDNGSSTGVGDVYYVEQSNIAKLDIATEKPNLTTLYIAQAVGGAYVSGDNPASIEELILKAGDTLSVVTHPWKGGSCNFSLLTINKLTIGDGTEAATFNVNAKQTVQLNNVSGKISNLTVGGELTIGAATDSSTKAYTLNNVNIDSGGKLILAGGTTTLGDGSQSVQSAGEIVVNTGASLKFAASDIAHWSNKTNISLLGGTWVTNGKRQSLAGGMTLKLDDGKITDINDTYGDGYGSVDFLGTATIESSGSSSIEGGIRIRDNNIEVKVTDGTLSIDRIVNHQGKKGGITKSGTGTLKLTSLKTGKLYNNVYEYFAGDTILKAGSVEFAIDKISDTSTNDGSYSGTISGTGNIVKSGTGTVTLASVRNLDGDISVTGGTLNITSLTANKTIDVTVTGGNLSITEIEIDRFLHQLDVKEGSSGSYYTLDGSATGKNDLNNGFVVSGGDYVLFNDYVWTGSVEGTTVSNDGTNTYLSVLGDTSTEYYITSGSVDVNSAIGAEAYVVQGGTMNIEGTMYGSDIQFTSGFISLANKSSTLVLDSASNAASLLSLVTTKEDDAGTIKLTTNTTMTGAAQAKGKLIVEGATLTINLNRDDNHTYLTSFSAIDLNDAIIMYRGSNSELKNVTVGSDGATLRIRDMGLERVVTFSETTTLEGDFTIESVWNGEQTWKYDVNIAALTGSGNLTIKGTTSASSPNAENKVTAKLQDTYTGSITVTHGAGKLTKLTLTADGNINLTGLNIEDGATVDLSGVKGTKNLGAVVIDGSSSLSLAGKLGNMAASGAGALTLAAGTSTSGTVNIANALTIGGTIANTGSFTLTNNVTIADIDKLSKVITYSGNGGLDGYISNILYYVVQSSGSGSASVAEGKKLNGNYGITSSDGSLVFEVQNATPGGIYYVNTQDFLVDGSAENAAKDATGYNIAAGKTLTISAAQSESMTAGKILSEATGEGNIELNTNASYSGNIASQAEGKLTINGVTLSVGCGTVKNIADERDIADGSNISSFSSVDLKGGTLILNGSGSTINSLTVSEGTSTLTVMNQNGGHQDYTLSGTTTLNADLDITSPNEHGNVIVKELTGSKNLSVVGGNATWGCTMVRLEKLTNYTGSITVDNEGRGEATPPKGQDVDYKYTNIEFGTAAAAAFTTLKSLEIKGNAYATVYAKGESTIESLTLANGTLNVLNLKTNASDADGHQTTNITSLSIDKTGTLGTTRSSSCYHGTINVVSLSHTGDSAALTLMNGSQCDATTTINLNDGSLKGAINVESNAVAGANQNRKLQVNINASNLAKDAVINFRDPSTGNTTGNNDLLVNNKQGNYNILGVGAATVNVAGLTGETTNAATIKSTDSSTRTLQIITAQGADYKTNAEVEESVNLVKSGEGAQTFAGSVDSTSVSVLGGGLSLTGIDTLQLQDLVVKSGATLSVGSNGSGVVSFVSTAATASTTSSTQGAKAKLEGGATINGDLDLSAATSLTLDGVGSNAVKINGDLTLTTGSLTLSGDVLKALAEIEAGERLTIMTIGENLIVNGQVITESITANSVDYSFAEVFTNEGYDDFYLGFDYVPDEAGYSTVYIGMIVPEPTTATLSLLALAALAARRRRK